MKSVKVPPVSIPTVITVGYRIGVAETLLLIVAAFLVGAIPFSFLAVWIAFRTDVREHGSGNPGATNASRRFPKRWRLTAFIGIFLLDAGKGYVAAELLPRLWGDLPGGAPAAAALAAVLGHSFSPFLRFRGGKGVATSLGALLALEPAATALALAAFFAVFLPTRIVAAGSLAAAVTLPIAVLARGRASTATGVVCVVLAVLIIVRHRSNIARLLRGEET